MDQMKIVYLSPDELTPYEHNAKLHPDEQVEHIANSIRKFGFRQPLVVDTDNVVVIGHGRLLAAQKLGLDKVPVLRVKQMTGGKLLWLRNNAATILCNCLENFGFIYLAFLGIYTAGQCFEIAIATSVIEIIAAVCDTPFAYIGRRLANTRE